MSRLNGLVKFAMINVNIVLAFIGFFCFGFAMYLWCSDWGNLDRGFFVGSGLVVALFGLSMFFLGCIGCLGIDHQGRINKPCLQSCAGKWYKSTSSPHFRGVLPSNLLVYFMCSIV